MDPEIIIAILIFVFSLAIIIWDRKLAVYVLIFLSILLHKELFSIYRWNLLPVRIFMFSFLVWAAYTFTDWLVRTRDLKTLWSYLKKPFIFLLLGLWLVRGISIFFSRNLFSSITLFGFFTTVVALGIFLYLNSKHDSKEVFSYIKFYIYVLFGLSVFAYFQAFFYLKTGIIIGALWNIPGKFPRLGSVFWDVNHFGGLLAALLPVLGVLILVSSKWKNRLLYGVMFFSMSGVLLFTNSRTSWILAFFAFVVFCAIWLFRKFGIKGIAGILLVLTLVSSAGFIAYSDKDSLFRKKIKDYFHYRIDSFDSHIMLLKGSWQVFEEFPYLGGGYGGFFEHFSQTEISAEYFGRDPAALNTRVPAHTIWGEVIAETGAVGLAIFVLFVFLILGTLLYLALNASEEKNALLSSAMFASLVGWLTAGVFYSYNSEFFFLIFFLYFLFGVSVLGEDYDLNKITGFFGKINKVPVIVIGTLAVGLLFIGLGKNHFIPWDEAIYAEISKNMLESGKFLTQFWRKGLVWYEKPPLYMWKMAGSMALFGVSEFAARLPSALAGLCTVMLVYFFAKRLFNKGAGFISGLVLITTVHFLYYSRTAMLDVTAGLFIAFSLALYYCAKEFAGKWEWYLWVLSGVSLGLAVMTKGIVGFLPLPIMLLYEIYLFSTSQGKLNLGLVKRFGSLVFSATLIFLPWHIYMYIRFGSSFVQNYIGYHVISRAVTAIEDKGRPFWWYYIVLRVSMRIWFLVLIPALFFSAVKLFKKDNRWAFLFIWFGFVYLFFSSARSKLVWYIIPIYPAAAILVGRFIQVFFKFGLQKFSFLKGSLAHFIFYFSLTFGSLFYLFLNRELVYTIDLTGAQAQLLEIKDEEFGTETKVYADRIDLPLVLYYSDGPYEIVDFGPLKRILLGAGSDERIVFITKESRFRAFHEIFPELKLERRINEWVLGYLPSREEALVTLLKDAEDAVDEQEERIAELDNEGKQVPAEEYRLLEELLVKENDLRMELQKLSQK